MIIGIITNALYAKFATEVKQIEEQVQLKQIMSDSSYTGSINDLLGFDSDYNNKLIVQEGNLVYVSDEVSSQEVKWLEKLGIEEASDYFTVEFDTFEENEYIENQIIKAGNLVSIPNKPTKANCEFNQWYYILEEETESEEPTYTEVPFDFNTPITQNYHLYAKYYGEAIMMSRNENEAFWTKQYRENIITIEFKQGELSAPETALKSWDIRADDTCSNILAYIETEETDNETYKLTVISPYTIYANTMSTSLFSGFNKLEHINFDNFNTNKVISMLSFFQECNSIKDLDLSGLNTKNICSTKNMFKNCKCLENLNLENFITSNVKNMQSMFYGCNNLLSIDLSSFDVSNVTTMLWMFYECNSLTSAKINHFDTKENVIIQGMFFNCISLKEVNLQNLKHARSTHSMFRNCQNLEKVNLENLETCSENMALMFLECTNIEEINFNSLDTSNVTNMSSLFQGCKNLKKLILSNWSFKNATDIAGIFSKVPKSVEIVTNQSAKDFLNENFSDFYNINLVD